MTYIIQLLIFLIEFSKGDPKRVRLSCCLHWIHSLHCLSVGVDDLQKVVQNQDPLNTLDEELLIVIPDGK